MGLIIDKKKVQLKNIKVQQSSSDRSCNEVYYRKIKKIAIQSIKPNNRPRTCNLISAKYSQKRYDPITGMSDFCEDLYKNPPLPIN